MQRRPLRRVAALAAALAACHAGAAAFAYVPNEKSATLSVIDTASAALVPVRKRPWNMALTPDGSRLYVANGRSDSVSVIDTTSNTRLNDIAVGALPWVC